MPVAYLDLPSGLGVDTKKKLVKEVAERVVLREWPAEQMSVDGLLGRPMWPICDFGVPPGLSVEAKRQLIKRVSSAIAEACSLPREEVPLPSGKKVASKPS